MERFLLKRMSTSVKNKLQMCWFTQHQCICCQICGKCSHINSLHSLWTVTKNDLSSLNNLSSNSLGCRLILKTNYRCVQSLNISVDVAKCVGNVHKFNQFTHFLSFPKNDLSLLNNLFMERFLLNRMSTSVENKLQMCWVTQHQCRRRKMIGKCSQIHPVHSLFVRYIKRLLQIEQSIHGKVSTR